MFAGLAIFPMGVWTAFTIANNDKYCWVVEHEVYSYMYILVGPRIFKLAVSPYLMV
jgi:hypothetical protein